MAKPFKHDFCNFTFTKPDNMDDGECGSLEVYKDDQNIVSSWKLSWRERFSALFFGNVWLHIAGQIQPPVRVSAHSKYLKKGDSPDTLMFKSE